MREVTEKQRNRNKSNWRVVRERRGRGVSGKRHDVVVLNEEGQ